MGDESAATNIPQEKGAPPTSLLLPPSFQGEGSIFVDEPFEERKEYHLCGAERLLLPGCDPRLSPKLFVIGPDGKKRQQVYGALVGDLVGAMGNCGLKRPPREAIIKGLSKLARQADSALGTCKGDHVPYLRAGLLRWRAVHQAEHGVYGHSSPWSGDSMPPGMPFSTVVTPTLAIIFAYEWMLNAAKPGSKYQHDDDAELARMMDSLVTIHDQTDFNIRQIDALEQRIHLRTGVREPPPLLPAKQCIESFAKWYCSQKRGCDVREVVQQLECCSEYDLHRVMKGAHGYVWPRAKPVGTRPLSTPQQLVNSLPDKLLNTARRLRFLIPETHTYMVDTWMLRAWGGYRDTPLGFKNWVFAESAALRRASYAAHHANVTMERGATPEDTLVAMLRAAKLSAWPRGETLDESQQRRLFAQALDESHAVEALPAAKCRKARRHRRDAGDFKPDDITAALDGMDLDEQEGETVHVCFDGFDSAVPCSYTVSQLNDLLQQLREENGMSVIPPVDGVVPFAFTVIGTMPSTVTTTLGDAISNAGLSRDGKITVSSEQLWVSVQLEGEGKKVGSPFRCIPETATPKTLVPKLDAALQTFALQKDGSVEAFELKLLLINCARENARKSGSTLLYEFYFGGSKLEGTLASVSGARGDTPIVVTFKRDLAFKRHVDDAWAAWEGCGVVPEMVPEMVSEAESAEASAMCAEITRMLTAMTEVGTPPELTPKSTPVQKAAYFLYAGMKALAASNGNSFELTKEMLLQGKGDIKPSILNCIINDLKRRENAPPEGTPTTRKAKRDEKAVPCYTSQHRFVLATCLHDAFMAFALDTPEAKASRAVFKPAKPARAGSSADA